MIKLVRKTAGKKEIYFRDAHLPKSIDVYDVDGINLFQSDLDKEYFVVYFYQKATEHKHQLITKGLPTTSQIEEALEKFEAYLKEYYGEKEVEDIETKQAN